LKRRPIECDRRLYKEFKKQISQRINNPMNKWENEQIILKKESEIGRYIKKCSISLAIKEIQIKTTKYKSKQ
jgi:hypothetical protein